jgi:UDP-3-O-[3-hydroxymyristoyl] N-acetylglucosamine deacetylase
MDLCHAVQPSTQNQQQTLQKSFTIAGVGLHTGEYTVIKVKPACAGEGRYFVRVPEGTNSCDFNQAKPSFVSREQLDIGYGAEDGLDPEDRAQLFLKYMQDEEFQENGESFGDYLKQNVSGLLQDDMIFGSLGSPSEDAVARSEEESASASWVQASIESAEVYGETTTLLRNGNFYVMSPEALLSALEACGVDNARVEIEGGSEVPVADGSALTWALEIQKAGVCNAPSAQGGSGQNESTATVSVAEAFSVHGGRDRPGAFVSFYPIEEESQEISGNNETIITAGVDFGSTAEVVGRQWVTWKTTDAKPEEEFARHYRWEIAPARQVFPSYETVEELYKDGLIQAGPDGCCVIAEGDSWYDPNLVRFPLDEAARNSAQRLMGVVSMCASPGRRGLPKGHIVAFDATPDMMIDFAAKLKAYM